MLRLSALVLGIVLVSGCGAHQREPLPGFPSLMLWAWERPENLTFIDPKQTGIAYLAETITLGDSRMNCRPRMQPLHVPPGTWVLPVFRIESVSEAHPPVGTVSQEIARATRAAGAQAVQIDFDARASERRYYRDLLEQVHRLIPKALLEMTALVSWCQRDNWIGGLPVVDAVPMYFRMGMEARLATEPLRAPACLASVGISVDEFSAPVPRGRRVYVFNPRAWTESDYSAVLRESKKW